MTHKQRMLATIRGRPTDRIPWAPRLDLWYRAHRRAGTLPERFRNATLRQMTDELGIGYHAVIPDFRDLRDPLDDADRALGACNIHTMPCRVTFENVGRTVRVQGDRTTVEYDTPHGLLRTVTVYDDAMRRAGVSITHVAEYAFKSPADYPALAYLFRNAQVAPNSLGYAAFADFVGDRGLAVAYVSSAASPMHRIQRELMPLETFFFQMHDRPDALAELADAVAGHYDRLLAAAVECPADVLLLGANYDASVTCPPFFAEHITPWLRRFADALHDRGRFLLTHTDGENRGLLHHYLEAGIDVADSVCPAPMTRLTFKQHRDAFNGRITIMGGIPSVALLADSMSDRDFDAFLDHFFENIGRGDHLILGISDTTPPGAVFERILAIGRRIEQFGAVVPASDEQPSPDARPMWVEP